MISWRGFSAWRKAGVADAAAGPGGRDGCGIGFVDWQESRHDTASRWHRARRRAAADPERVAPVRQSRNRR
jgi:hypothetical protein